MPHDLPGSPAVTEPPGNAGVEERFESVPLAIVLVIAFVLGLAVGEWQSRIVIWPWVVAAAVCIAIGVVIRKRQIGVVVLLSVAMFCIGAAWITINRHRVAAN